MSEWQDIASAPTEGWIIGGFFTDDGSPFNRPAVVDCRQRDYPRRIEFYVEKQRVFPTHFIDPLPDAPARKGE